MASYVSRNQSITCRRAKIGSSIALPASRCCFAVSRPVPVVPGCKLYQQVVALPGNGVCGQY